MSAFTLAAASVVLAIVTKFTVVSPLTFLAAHPIGIAVVFAAPPIILAALLVFAAFLILTAVLIFAAVLVLALILIVVAVISNNSSRSYPHPSPRHHETTRLLHQSSYQPPTYDRSLYGPSSVPPAGESRQATSTSAHSLTLYQRPSSPYPAHNFISAHEVDLHGYYVRDALKRVEQELQSASQRGNRKIHFIVGKGLHSENGQPKIRPAVKNFCDERGLTCSLDPKNSGVLIVQVD